MIRLEHLTQDQVDMLDMMWSLDSMEDFVEWYGTLSKADQEQADTLQRMIILAELDNLVDNIVTEDLSLANEVLKKFVLH